MCIDLDRIYICNFEVDAVGCLSFCFRDLIVVFRCCPLVSGVFGVTVLVIGIRTFLGWHLIDCGLEGPFCEPFPVSLF